MSSVHFHLLFNHVAILGILFSVVIFIAGVFFRQEVLKRTALVGFIVASISTMVVMKSGEGAEEAVEHIAGVGENVIHEHEEAAEFAMWVIAVLGIASVFGFLNSLRSGSLKKGLQAVVLVSSLLAGGSIAYTGLLGGKIRHTEIASGAVSQDGMNQSEEEEESH